MTTAATVSVRLDLISKDFEKGLDEAKGKVKQFSADIEKAGRTLRNVGAGMTAAFTVPMVAMGVKAAMTAGRVDELDLVVRTLGKTAGYSETEIDGYVKAVQKMGIEAGASREVVAKFVTAQLNAADASKIARIAQDQAVITGENSTQTTMRLTDAIVKGSQETFRAMMMNINLSHSYEAMAKELGIATEELTEAERVQARVNAVIEYGATVTGTYEASMESGTKQLRSYRRYIDDIFVAVGQHLTPALNDVVFAGADFLKWIKKAVSEGGEFAPLLESWGGTIKGFAGFLGDIMDGLKNVNPAVVKFFGGLSTLFAVMGPILLVGGQIVIMIGKLKVAMAALGTTASAALGPIYLLTAALAALAIHGANQRAEFDDVRKGILETSITYEDYARRTTEAALEQGWVIDEAGKAWHAYTGEMNEAFSLITPMEWALQNLGIGIDSAKEGADDFSIGLQETTHYMSLAERQAQLTTQVTWEQAAALRGLGDEYNNFPTDPKHLYVDLDTQAALDSLDELRAKFEEDLVHAMEALTTAQNSWKTGVADDLVQGLKDAGLSGDELIERLEAIDEAFGTQHAMEHRYEVEYDLLMPELLQRLLEDPQSFVTEAAVFIDYMMPLETSIYNASLKVDEIQTKLNEIAKEYEAIFRFTLDDPFGLMGWTPPGNTTSIHRQVFTATGGTGGTGGLPIYPQATGGFYQTSSPTLFGTSEFGQPETALFIPHGKSIFDIASASQLDSIMPDGGEKGAVYNYYTLNMPTTADPTDVGMAFELLEAYGGN